MEKRQDTVRQLSDKAQEALDALQSLMDEAKRYDCSLPIPVIVKAMELWGTDAVVDAMQFLTKLEEEMLFCLNASDEEILQSLIDEGIDPGEAHAKVRKELLTVLLRSAFAAKDKSGIRRFQPDKE
jgi:hypothetical protein